MTGAWQMLQDNAVLVALIWMLLANLAAVGPGRTKVAALVIMIVTAGAIIPTVIRTSGWLIGLPVMLLMGLQMRWAFYMIWRLIRRWRGLPPPA